MTRLPLIAALLFSTQAHAGVYGVTRSIDLDAVRRCVTEVTGMEMATVPEVRFSDQWSEVSASMCCDRAGREFRGTAASVLTINHITKSRTVTLYRSAGFEQAVHEFAADAYVQNGGNPFDKQAREHIGYRAEWAAHSCKRKG
jgi:hypothetical protein